MHSRMKAEINRLHPPLPSAQRWRDDGEGVIHDKAEVLCCQCIFGFQVSKPIERNKLFFL